MWGEGACWGCGGVLKTCLAEMGRWEWCVAAGQSAWEQGGWRRREDEGEDGDAAGAVAVADVSCRSGNLGDVGSSSKGVR